jgi:anti-sigma-K factor RskA
MSVDEHVEDLLPAYALGCLDEDEAVWVKEHLAECLACQTELRVYQAVVDHLPLAVPAATPPAHVKQALVDRIQPREYIERAPAERSWQERISIFTRRLSPVWSVVSLFLILILAASNLVLWRQVSRLSNAQEQALRTINLTGTDAAPGATGLLVISLNGQHGTLVVDELPDLNDQWEYQLWLIDPYGNRTSGGVFSVREGYGAVWVKSPQPLAHYAGFGVTVEPSGGSAAPTGKKVLGGDL